MGTYPKCIYIFSGKRKSGKDYVTDNLYCKLQQEQTVIIKLSGPIKHLHSQQNRLNYESLMDSSEYKEAYRKDMVKWSEKLRNEDYGYFCRAAIQMSKAENYPFWIVSDARRKSDIRWFKENYRNVVIKTFLIVCDDSIRKQRGWVFTKGIDDEETECGLDDFVDWDQIIPNDGTKDLDGIIDHMVEEVNFLVFQTKINTELDHN